MIVAVFFGVFFYSMVALGSFIRIQEGAPDEQTGRELAISLLRAALWPIG
jgi:hypothetical protein